MSLAEAVACSLRGGIAGVVLGGMLGFVISALFGTYPLFRAKDEGATHAGMMGGQAAIVQTKICMVICAAGLGVVGMIRGS